MAMNFNFLIELLIKLGIIIILIMAASMNHQYSYYLFVRWTVTFSSLYFVYKSHKRKRNGLLIYYCAVALLFNPFEKFTFQKNIWNLIDFLISAITIITIVIDILNQRNKKQRIQWLETLES